ncbi:hypothetical protein D9M69_397560 [compost metagenome]
MHQPQRAGQADHACSADQQPAVQQDAMLAARDEGRHRGIGLGHGERADDAVPIAITFAYRGGHVHHGTGLVLRIAARAARAVLAAQRQVDIVPARIVAAHVGAGGVVADDAAGVGDIDAVADAVLVPAPYVGIDRRLAQRRHAPREVAIGDAAGLDVVGGQRGQHVGGVDQRVFHRLPYAGLDLLHEHAQRQHRRQAHDQEEAEEDAQADPHGALSSARDRANSPCRGACGCAPRLRLAGWPRAAWRAAS